MPHPRIQIAAFDGSSVKARTAPADLEADATHTVLNGLRSKLSLEGPYGEPGPSDAEVMEVVEGYASSERSHTNRFNGRFWTRARA